MNTASAYQELAERHRPIDPAALAQECQRLSSQGWTWQDISTSLRLSPMEVWELLAAAQ